jgi:hypothetical protein
VELELVVKDLSIWWGMMFLQGEKARLPILQKKFGVFLEYRGSISGVSVE